MTDYESNCLKDLTKTKMANSTTTNEKQHGNHLGAGIVRRALLAHKDGPLNNQAVLDAVVEAVEAAEAVEHNELV